MDALAIDISAVVYFLDHGGLACCSALLSAVGAGVMSHSVSRKTKKSHPKIKDPALARCDCCGEEVRLSETPSLFPIQEKFLKPLNIIYGLFYVLPVALAFLISSQSTLGLNITFSKVVVVCLLASLVHYFVSSERVKFHVLFTQKPLSCSFAYIAGRFFFFRRKDLLGIFSTWQVPPLLVLLSWRIG